MENTPLNKVKFMSQYWGQKVFINPMLSETPVENIYLYDYSEPEDIDSEYLELTPLRLISDEDLEYIALKISRVRDSEWSNRTLEMTNKFKKVIIEEYSTGLSISDFLRLKSYAIEWNGLSVEQQVDYGWVKLKTEI